MNKQAEEYRDVLIRYLKMVASVAEMSVEAVVLRRGKYYPAPSIARPKGLRKGADKRCFKNAYHLCIERGYTYVEGIAYSLIPLHHAWCVDEAGNVIETTWRAAGDAYYGIEFPIPFVNQVAVETGFYGAMDYRSETFKRFAEKGVRHEYELRRS